MAPTGHTSPRSGPTVPKSAKPANIRTSTFNSALHVGKQGSVKCSVLPKQSLSSIILNHIFKRTDIWSSSREPNAPCVTVQPPPAPQHPSGDHPKAAEFHIGAKPGRHLRASEEFAEGDQQAPLEGLASELRVEDGVGAEIDIYDIAVLKVLLESPSTQGRVHENDVRAVVFRDSGKVIPYGVTRRGLPVRSRYEERKQNRETDSMRQGGYSTLKALEPEIKSLRRVVRDIQRKRAQARVKLKKNEAGTLQGFRTANKVERAVTASVQAPSAGEQGNVVAFSSTDYGIRTMSEAVPQALDEIRTQINRHHVPSGSYLCANASIECFEDGLVSWDTKLDIIASM
ncbi:hypothetical protein BCR41DRAFT_394333 [Lobosporangium transversale]|uniref:Uncharacterized protein n=1 Tax=Lobosporangium transversale TaxID=64571 RepID=A0A1Y2GTB1_9FUNG|nr:hypothetical protein BCR41DRAFT_394333 [Lobosporangium transversale]ORZ22757.1 hypothetical protein BCR41DRAFT_394333 [Lobosporangium transversale]|eukprot:XP_021883311.1 hypothetical protein BCR41DRAFT_394333 [Lobosporangium transversale]